MNVWLQQKLEKYLPLISGMLIPAAFFAVAFLSFLAKEGFSYETAKIFHSGFYLISGLFLIFLININDGRPLFFGLILIVGYTLVNYLKSAYGEQFKETIWYQNLSILLPINLLFFYFYAPRRLISRKTFYLLVAIAGEYACVEMFCRQGLRLEVSEVNYGAMTCFALLGIVTLGGSVKNGQVLDYGFLFAVLSTAAGIFFASSAAGRSLFFCLAQGILFGSVVYTSIYNRYYDRTTGFYSRYSYQKQSKSFPLKYSLGIVSLDGYDKFLTSVGKKKTEVLAGLVAGVIQELLPEETNVYRYADDEFVILYKKLDKKESFKEADDLRRTIAGISFAFEKKQKIPVKLTISCSVAEKKRSDSGAEEVLARADKALRSTLKFSHNVTSKG